MRYDRQVRLDLTFDPANRFDHRPAKPNDTVWLGNLDIRQPLAMNQRGNGEPGRAPICQLRQQKLLRGRLEKARQKSFPGEKPLGPVFGNIPLHV